MSTDIATKLANLSVDADNAALVINGDATLSAIPLRTGGTARSLRNAAATIAKGDKGDAGGFPTVAVPASMNDFVQFNPTGTRSTTAINPGLTLFNSSGYVYGIDFGYAFNSFHTRLFAPSSGEISLSFSSVANPTLQSQFSCSLLAAVGDVSLFPVADASGAFLKDAMHIKPTQVQVNVPLLNQHGVTFDPTILWVARSVTGSVTLAFSDESDVAFGLSLTGDTTLSFTPAVQTNAFRRMFLLIRCNGYNLSLPASSSQIVWRGGAAPVINAAGYTFLTLASSGTAPMIGDI